MILDKNETTNPEFKENWMKFNGSNEEEFEKYLKTLKHKKIPFDDTELLKCFETLQIKQSYDPNQNDESELCFTSFFTENALYWIMFFIIYGSKIPKSLFGSL